ncbi:uncharacterized protein [Dendrobates tinctorius]|uniref:uncharacterized protein n=1 Tax=Dendrobates tinctorius TaxID=92724 RepID=UPI003CC98ED3
MMIIVFFALASASTCWGLKIQSDDSAPPYPTFRCDSPYINKYAADKSCLEHALEVVPNLVVAGNTLICKHYWGLMNYRFEFYNIFTAEVKAFLECAGCKGDGLLGFGNVLEATGAHAGDILAEVFPPIAEIIHHTPLAPQLLDVMCYTLSDTFTSTCLPLITYNVNLLVHDLETLACQKKQKKFDPNTLVAIVENAGCLVGTLTGTNDVVEPIIGTVGDTLDPVVSHVADLVLGLPVVGNLVKAVICLLTNLLGSG